MKINFASNSIDGYVELLHQTKRVHESTECVVPDVNDDIGRIASVQTAVYLKSKDVGARAVQISGEAVAAILYITEGEYSVSFLKLTKTFSMEFDLGETESEVKAQINLSILNAEAHILNPRKVSVTFDISGELTCYTKESIDVESSLPEISPPGLHARYKECDMTYINSVSEKTFTLSEQFAFPGGKPTPSQVVMPKVCFSVNDSQLIGTKAIIKGNMELSTAYISDEVNYPVKIEFSTPFSQIIDLGEEEMDSCSAFIEITSLYYDVVKTINGENALDLEVHAVLQLISHRKRKLQYVSDAYSNLMPGTCNGGMITFVGDIAEHELKLITDERLNVAEDCADVLSVFTVISQLNTQSDKIIAVVSLDIIYRKENGALSSVRRQLSLSADCVKAPDRILSTNLSDIYLRPDGANIDCHIGMELSCLNLQCKELYRAFSVDLNEEESYDLSSRPTVTLVRAEKEDLWDLAKIYHSSVEKILSVNDLSDGSEGKLLLIPASI